MTISNGAARRVAKGTLICLLPALLCYPGMPGFGAPVGPRAAAAHSVGYLEDPGLQRTVVPPALPWAGPREEVVAQPRAITGRADEASLLGNNFHADRGPGPVSSWLRIAAGLVRASDITELRDAALGAAESAWIELARWIGVTQASRDPGLRATQAVLDRVEVAARPASANPSYGFTAASCGGQSPQPVLLAVAANHAADGVVGDGAAWDWCSPVRSRPLATGLA